MAQFWLGYHIKHLFNILFAVLLLYAGLPLTASGQGIKRSCPTDELYNLELAHNPKFKQNRLIIETHQKNFIASQGFRSSQINIPIVIHILYHTDDQNINDALIQSQLDILNQDFGSIQTGKYPQASASRLKFALATVDPNGHKTNGITRTYTSSLIFQTGTMIMSSRYGGADPWPVNEYLNIWIGNLYGVLGYAYMPGSLSDGVVIGYQFFGNNQSLPFNLGRTTTHEVGHWLNLYHTWGLSTGCEADDEVEDTPNSAGPNYGCQPDHASCGGIDMVENYMDYSDDACMNLFTKGQVQRMEALFAPGGYRSSLLASHGLDIGIQSSCTNGIQDGDETGIDCGGTCGPCGCSGKGSFSSFDYIESIKINDSVSISGDNDGTFTNYRKLFNLYTNVPNRIVFTPGQSAYPSLEFWSAWIDWNKDGFYNEDERIYKNMELGPVKDSIDLNSFFVDKVLPASDTYRIRIQMQWGTYGPGCDTFDFGEVENYSVMLKQAYIDPCANGIRDGKETGIDCGPECKPCILNYCESKGKISKYEFIQSIVLGGWNNTTGNNNGYADYTGASLSLPAGQDFNYTLTSGFAGKYVLAENWYAWADWNQDGDFDDPGEQLLEANSTLPQTGTWKIPDGTKGKVRLRIQMRDSRKANACETFGYGEVEDYLLDVQPINPRISSLLNEGYNVNVYPNPVSNNLQIQLADNTAVTIQIKLVNDLGQVFYNNPSVQSNTLSIDCRAIPQGVYFLILEHDRIKDTKRILIVHGRN